MDKFQPHKSFLDLDANLVMLIAYFGAVIVSFIPGISILAWAVPLVVYFVEKDSKYVKFHAMQSLLLEAIGVAVSIIIGILFTTIFTLILFSGSGTGAFGLVGLTGIIAIIVPIVLFIFSIVAAIKSWNYECYKIPVIGDWAEKITNKY